MRKASLVPASQESPPPCVCAVDTEVRVRVQVRRGRAVITRKTDPMCSPNPVDLFSVVSDLSRSLKNVNHRIMQAYEFERCLESLPVACR